MNLLLPVSHDSAFPDAVSLAIDTAKMHGGKIRILSVVDEREIQRVEEGAPPGAIHLAQHAAEEVERRLTDEAAALVREATHRCTLAGVAAQGDVREGEPDRELVAAAGGADVLVAAMASHFDPGLDDAAGKFVLAVMREAGIPVLLASSPFRPVRTVVVGCGGGIRTERAVGTMTRLSLWREGVRGILLAVDDDPEKGQSRLATARQLLSDAGYPPWEEQVIPGPRRETFHAFCEAQKADVVVLGGWGEHWWHNLLGQSITGRLLEEGRRNVFLCM
ncbi:MAG: universal stress protein [Verrucomicrobiota bacterium]